jgi:hypothetical protein
MNGRRGDNIFRQNPAYRPAGKSSPGGAQDGSDGDNSMLAFYANAIAHLLVPAATPSRLSVEATLEFA